MKARDSVIPLFIIGILACIVAFFMLLSAKREKREMVELLGKRLGSPIGITTYYESVWGQPVLIISNTTVIFKDLDAFRGVLSSTNQVRRSVRNDWVLVE